MSISKNVRPADRAEKILEAYSTGASTKQIANRFNVTPQAVRARLKAQGVDFEQDDRTSLWTLPEDRRREAITNRAARGAAEALRKLHKTVTPSRAAP